MTRLGLLLGLAAGALLVVLYLGGDPVKESVSGERGAESQPATADDGGGVNLAADAGSSEAGSSGVEVYEPEDSALAGREAKPREADLLGADPDVEPFLELKDWNGGVPLPDFHLRVVDRTGHTVSLVTDELGHVLEAPPIEHGIVRIHFLDHPERETQFKELERRFDGGTLRLRVRMGPTLFVHGNLPAGIEWGELEGALVGPRRGFPIGWRLRPPREAGGLHWVRFHRTEFPRDVPLELHLLGPAGVERGIAPVPSINGPHQVAVHFESCTSVSGRIESSDPHRVVEETRVVLSTADGAEWWALVDEAGRFFCGGLPPGELRVWAHAKGHRLEERRLPGTAGKESELLLVLEASKHAEETVSFRGGDRTYVLDVPGAPGLDSGYRLTHLELIAEEGDRFEYGWTEVQWPADEGFAFRLWVEGHGYFEGTAADFREQEGKYVFKADGDYAWTAVFRADDLRTGQPLAGIEIEIDGQVGVTGERGTLPWTQAQAPTTLEIRSPGWRLANVDRSEDPVGDVLRGHFRKYMLLVPSDD